MAKKKQIIEDQASDNAGSVKMKDNKSNQLSQAITLMASMSGDDITKLLQVLQQNSTSASASIPDDAAAKNAASVAMKGAIKEELADLFGSEELSEEFKEKTITIFEAAVNARVAMEVASLEDKLSNTLEEHAEETVVFVSSKIDQYLTHVAENWLVDNEIALESAIRTEIAEQFMHGLKELFKSNYIDIPDEKIDIVEDLVNTVNEMKAQLNETIKSNIELKSNLDQLAMESVFESVSSGLALSQSTKFRTLAEGIEFDGDIETYERKLNIVKNKYFNESKKAGSQNALVLNESYEGDDAVHEEVSDPTIKRYAEAISRNAKK